MECTWTFNEADRGAAMELQSLLPAKAFDMHAHIYRLADFAERIPFWQAGPEDATVQVWREHVARQLPDVDLAGGLFFPVPFVSPAPDGSGLDAANDFLVEQLSASPTGRGELLIGPQYSAERVLKYLRNPQVVGFKPYHLLGTQKPTWEAPIESYLPHWAWEMAHERGLTITLHMVRNRALADRDNQREIREMCLKYPGAKLILAHAARGFHPQNTIRGLPALKGLENVWFDTSAVCEPAAILAILNSFGPGRVVWGSDFPASESRGKCVSLGDGFAWLVWDTVNWDNPQVMGKPILVGIESLRAVLDAADAFGLGRQDIEDIFHNNACRLLGIEAEPGTLTQDLYARARQRIPGGTQLFSKRPENFAPNQWPAYFGEARGCEIWDMDGRHYYDMATNSVGACLLGYRDPDVTRAVRRRLNLGSISSLSPSDELELADRLCEIHPWAEQVRFARGGGEACAVAVRIARATTDRSLVAVCGYHGWHDWYLAANLGESDALRGHLLPGLDPLGVPVELRGTTLTFTYNNREEFERISSVHGDRLAAVIMEPCRHHDPDPGFLEFVRDEAHRRGALLIFDEVSIGWRLAYGGAHLKLGIAPDMAVFAKALGNGHPIGAVIGTRPAMEGAHTSFISSTYWTDGVGPAAALATLEKMRLIDVPAHVARIGKAVREHWRQLGRKHGLPIVAPDGYPCQASFSFDHDQANALRTLYTQLMLERGFLAGPGFYPTLAHTEEIIALFARSVDETFERIAQVIAHGDVAGALSGPPAHSGFRRLV